MNYGNENDLAKRSQVKHAGIHTGAYVFHYKGSTMNRHKGTGGPGEKNFNLGHHGATHHSHGALLPDGSRPIVEDGANRPDGRRLSRKERRGLAWERRAAGEGADGGVSVTQNIERNERGRYMPGSEHRRSTDPAGAS